MSTKREGIHFVSIPTLVTIMVPDPRLHLSDRDVKQRAEKALKALQRAVRQPVIEIDHSPRTDWTIDTQDT